MKLLLVLLICMMPAVGMASRSNAPLAYETAQKVLYSGPSVAYFNAYDAAVGRGQCTSLLAQLNAALKSDDADKRYGAEIVYAELYDRALCVDFAPERAFELFVKSADFGNPVFYAHVGWKYFYGHGVVRSTTNAHEAFKKFFLFTAHEDHHLLKKTVQKISRLRPLPDIFQQGYDWYLKKLVSQDLQFLLAKEMLGYGQTLRYHDGSPIPINPFYAEQRLRILSRSSFEVAYFYAQEMIKGTFEHKDRSFGQILLSGIAHCAYAPAMVLLGDLYTDESGVFTRHEKTAYLWYKEAQKQGVDVDLKIKKLEEKLKSSYVMWELQNTTQGILRPERCKYTL